MLKHLRTAVMAILVITSTNALGNTTVTWIANEQIPKNVRNLTAEDSTYQTIGQGTLENPFTASDAIWLANNGEYVDEECYIKGIVFKVNTTDTNIGKYGNIDYFISEDGQEKTPSFEVYRGKYFDGAAFTVDNKVQVGDEVIVKGKMTMYNTQEETAAGAVLVSLEHGGQEDKQGDDVTALMVNPDFEEGTNGWTRVAAGGGNVTTGSTTTNTCYEAWNNSNFDIYQLVENAPAGTYKIVVQGFYRYLRNDNAYSAYVDAIANGTPIEVPVYVYMNNVNSSLVNIFSEQVPVNTLYSTQTYTDPNGENWYPDGFVSANEAFSAGMYTATASCTIAEGESLRIGVKGGTDQGGDSWACWDNFKLYYLGTDSLRSLSVTTTGNGSAYFHETEVRDTTSTFQVAEGSTIKIAVKADTNHRPDQVLVNGSVAQVVNDTLTITNISDNTNVYISFAQNSTTLTIIAEGEGTVSVDSTNIRNDSQTMHVIAGIRPMLTMQPDTHHRVDSLTVNGVSRLADLQGNGILLLDSVTTATTVFVRFAQIYHTLTLNASTHGTITYIDSSGDSIHVTGSVQVFQVAEGASIPLRIKAIANYHMGSITLNGESISDQLDKNGNYKIESMVEDVDVRASFCLDETVTAFSSPSFIVTLNPNGGTAQYFSNYYRLGNGGSLTLRGKSNVNKIVNVKMNLQDPARSGNDVMVSSGTLVGDSIIDVNDTTLTITARGSWPQLWLSSLTVTYEGTAPLGTYAIRLPQYQTNGTVTSSHDWADEGDEVTLTATPNEGYHLSHLYANRGAVMLSPSATAIDQFTFTMPAEDVTIGAVFAEGDITTGVLLNAPEDSEANATPIYNLQGQRIKRLQRGVNIVGGRKQVCE